MRLLVACGAAAGIASAYSAPISGSVFVAEIVLGSMAVEIFGPLVFASVIATLTVRGFLGPELHVRDLMKPNPLTISSTTAFSEIAEKFIAARFNYLYVTDHGNFLGAVSLHDIKSYLNTPELARVVIAGDLLRDSIPLVRANASLIEALERFSHHDGERLPVVSHDRHLAGSIAKTDVILALAGSTVRSGTTTGPPALR